MIRDSMSDTELTSGVADVFIHALSFPELMKALNWQV